MLRRMKDNPPFGFVMCSTEYRTRETNLSPFGRGKIEQVYNVHDFSKDDVKNILFGFF